LRRQRWISYRAVQENGTNAGFVIGNLKGFVSSYSTKEMYTKVLGLDAFVAYHFPEREI